MYLRSGLSAVVHIKKVHFVVLRRLPPVNDIRVVVADVRGRTVRITELIGEAGSTCCATASGLGGTGAGASTSISTTGSRHSTLVRSGGRAVVTTTGLTVRITTTVVVGEGHGELVHGCNIATGLAFELFCGLDGRLR